MGAFFFGIEADGAWPEKMPGGRIIEEEHRHVTLAFLGPIDGEALLGKMEGFPAPQSSLGYCGFADGCIFLPPRRPRVVAWHIHLRRYEELADFCRELNGWLEGIGFAAKNSERKFLPHLTIARGHFHMGQWERGFTPFPVQLSSINLYESLGYSKYAKRWSYPLLPGIEEIEHTADVAFIIRGNSLEEVYENAFLALAFQYPPLLHYRKEEKAEDLPAMIEGLNRCVAECDADIGIPLKAVSYHGEITDQKPYEWKMIVDV